MATEDSNLVSLKEFIEVRFDAQDKATSLAALNMQTRLDSLNEWRLQNKDERAAYLTRVEFQAQINSVAAMIKSLELSRAELAGKASQNSVNFAILIAILGLAIGAIGLLT